MLCIQCPLYIDARLLWEQAICSNSTEQIDDEIIKASVSGMLYLCNILQLIIHGFYNSPLSEQELSETPIKAPFILLFN